MGGTLPQIETSEQEKVIKYLVYHHGLHGKNAWLGEEYTGLCLIENIYSVYSTAHLSKVT